ncbi:MAG: GNAT family N-acetyltransferase [Acidobacteria bacterium]|nr:GNAT family N-acetyltransferase [Acidobacteriota bacterium]
MAVRAREAVDRTDRNGTSRVEIREMELVDLSAVYELGEKLFTPELSAILYRTWDQYELIACFASDGETCLVAEQDERIVGFAIGTLLEKPRSAWTYGWLLWLGVDPEFASHGVGRRLVRRVTELLIERGARMMIVDTDASNARAIEFFRGQGFGDESEHVYLWKNLTQEPGYHRNRERGGNRTIRKVAGRRPNLPKPDEDDD